jgi:phosphopantetheinyl transferase
MPLVHHLQVKNGEIMHWEVTESLHELIHIAENLNINKEIPQYIEARQKQILVMRILHKMIAPGTEIIYEATGKPVLSPSGNISFTHSRHHIAVYRCDQECGVDLEQLHKRVIGIRHKYINDAEHDFVHSEDVELLIRLWSAKEAMFKVYGKDGVFLRSNIFVTEMNRDYCKATLKDGDTIINRTIRFRSIEDMILAWTELT